MLPVVDTTNGAALLSVDDCGELNDTREIHHNRFSASVKRALPHPCQIEVETQGMSGLYNASTISVA